MNESRATRCKVPPCLRPYGTHPSSGICYADFTSVARDSFTGRSLPTECYLQTRPNQAQRVVALQSYRTVIWYVEGYVSSLGVATLSRRSPNLPASGC